MLSKRFYALRVPRVRALTLSATSPPLSQWAQNAKLRAFVEQSAELLAPARVHLCDGTAAEQQRLLREMEVRGEGEDGGSIR